MLLLPPLCNINELSLTRDNILNWGDRFAKSWWNWCDSIYTKKGYRLIVKIYKVSNTTHATIQIKYFISASTNFWEFVFVIRKDLHVISVMKFNSNLS